MTKTNTKQNIKVAVDNCIFTIIDGKLNILLIQMKKSPFENLWALPGGLISNTERLDTAAKNILKEQTNLTDVFLEQLYTFCDIKRDPFGRVISVAYFALVPSEHVTLKTSEKYADVKFMEVKKIKKLAYDHKDILRYALSRLRSKLEYTNVVYSLLPDKFTLTKLQEAYEIILDKKLDKRNFRKKIDSLNIIKKLNSKTTGHKHRPANLYKFINKNPAIIKIL